MYILLIYNWYKFNRDLWNSATNSNAIELSAITNNSICIINSSKYTIPKNINKRNAKGETYLHIACVKVNFYYLWHLK